MSKQTPKHRDSLPRINRIAGQINGIRSMIEEGRSCTDIMIQLRAVRSALKSVESHILNTHLQQCVAESLGGQTDARQKIEELQTIFNRFDDV